MYYNKTTCKTKDLLSLKITNFRISYETINFFDIRGERIFLSVIDMCI